MGQPVFNIAYQLWADKTTSMHGQNAVAGLGWQ
jgi:hypothetical protein